MCGRVHVRRGECPCLRWAAADENEMNRTSIGTTRWRIWMYRMDRTQEIFLEPSFETRYSYYNYSAPDPLSWHYSSTVVNNW